MFEALAIAAFLSIIIVLIARCVEPNDSGSEDSSSKKKKTS